MNDRIAFTLGWDYSSFGLPLPDNSPHSMKQGHDEGRRHFQGKVTQADYLDRKWLQIRFGAFKRGRVFDDRVTPEEIHKMSQIGICPVSEAALTAGTLLDTDWSIDRIISDGAYTPENLMVVSTRVNAAKGAKSLDQIRAIKDGIEEDDALTMPEWTRLFLLMQHVYYHAGLISDEQFEIAPGISVPPHLKTHYTDVIMKVMSMHFIGPGWLMTKEINDVATKIRLTCGSTEARMRYKKLQRKFEKYFSEGYSAKMIWERPGMFESYKKLVEIQRRMGIWPVKIQSTLETWNRNLNVNEFKAGMSIDTRGYEI